MSPGFEGLAGSLCYPPSDVLAHSSRAASGLTSCTAKCPLLGRLEPVCLAQAERGIDPEGLVVGSFSLLVPHSQDSRR